MITAQDIREKTFEKARFSGYDMASVDDFLEELAEDVTATQKENAVLKSKMKVLVDKNMAVLSAQKLAVQIENDARARASAMLAEADKQVKAKVGSIAEQTAAQEKRLADAKAATAKFFDGVRALCNTQLKNIDAISSGIISSPEPEAVPAPRAAAPSVEDAVRSIENSVARIQPEPSIQIDIPKTVDAPASKPAVQFDSTQPFTL